MNVEWSDDALADLDRFAAFLHQHHPSLATIIAQKIIAKAQILSDHPRLGRAIGGREEYRELVLRVLKADYVFQYEVDVKRVLILRVFHGRKIASDPKRLRDFAQLYQTRWAMLLNLETARAPRSFRARLPGASKARSMLPRSASQIEVGVKCSSISTNNVASQGCLSLIEPTRWLLRRRFDAILRVLICNRRPLASSASNPASRGGTNCNPSRRAASYSPTSPVIPSGFPVNR